MFMFRSYLLYTCTGGWGVAENDMITIYEQPLIKTECQLCLDHHTHILSGQVKNCLMLL